MQQVCDKYFSLFCVTSSVVYIQYLMLIMSKLHHPLLLLLSLLL